MEITSSIIRGTVPVTVLHLDGRMDGSNYQDLINMAQKLYESGSRDLLLDFSRLSFLSSAGISAVHRAALIFGGKKAAEMEEGWAAFRAMDRDRERGKQQHVKLLRPSEEIRRILDTVGFGAFFEIHEDLKEAVASFQ